DVPLPDAPSWYVVSLLLATASSCAIGAIVTSVAGTTRAAQSVGMVFFFPLMFTAGVYSPVPAMSGLLHDVVTATPLGAGAEALNEALLGRSPDLTDLAVMGG